MKIPTSSRYVSSYDTYNNQARSVAVRVATSSKSYITHVAQEKESFATLAKQYFNDDKMYWYIADQNPHVKYPDLIPPGTVIRIPIA